MTMKMSATYRVGTYDWPFFDKVPEKSGILSITLVILIHNKFIAVSTMIMLCRVWFITLLQGIYILTTDYEIINPALHFVVKYLSHVILCNTLACFTTILLLEIEIA